MSTDLPTLAVTGSTGGLGGRVARRLAELGYSAETAGPHRPERLRADRRRWTTGTTTTRERPQGPPRRRHPVHGLRLRERGPARPAQDIRGRRRGGRCTARHVHLVLRRGGRTPPSPSRATTTSPSSASGAGTDWTFLRDNLYPDWFPDLVGEDGVIRGPAGHGRRRGRSGRRRRRRRGGPSRPGAHAGTAYELTGPESLTLDGRRRDPSARARARRHLPAGEGRGGLRLAPKWAASAWQNDAWVSTYTAMASGELRRGHRTTSSP